MGDLVQDLAMEIVYGCDRFDKSDIRFHILEMKESGTIDHFRDKVMEAIIELDPPCQGLEDDADGHKSFYQESIDWWTN